uniref:Uncharacterized protein n=1 Tax=Octopus bimaculoides TaxID=37653 RepID=A0A0L8FW99_OCTBM
MLPVLGIPAGLQSSARPYWNSWRTGQWLPGIILFVKLRTGWSITDLAERILLALRGIEG